MIIPLYLSFWYTIFTDWWNCKYPLSSSHYLASIIRNLKGIFNSKGLPFYVSRAPWVLCWQRSDRILLWSLISSWILIEWMTYSGLRWKCLSFLLFYFFLLPNRRNWLSTYFSSLLFASFTFLPTYQRSFDKIKLWHPDIKLWSSCCAWSLKQ